MDRSTSTDLGGSVNRRFSRALVRTPGPTFVDGLTNSGDLGRPDLRKALEQHGEYCRVLAECGLEVTALPPDDQYPDGTFVEDTAVLAKRVTVITRPGAPSRQGEIQSIQVALGRFHPKVERIDAPGTVDGGDICEFEGHFLIGLSERTNEAGAHQLARILAPHGYSTSTLDIRGHRSLLHLKSGISYLGDRRFVVADGFPKTQATSGYETIEVAPEEAYAANCVRINDYVLIASGYPGLAARLQNLGLRTKSLDMSEFRKLDGGLSCLSLRF
jgi:dimethylargininase